jgi:hypothetical protein
LCDELVGPSGDDRLAGGVPRRVVVVAALGTALGIAARPYAHIHGEDGRVTPGERMASQKLPQGFVVDASAIQGGVEAAPAATMRRLEAQVGGGRSGAVRYEDGVGQFEEGVASRGCYEL